jgi:TolA-binding protein
MKRSFIIILLTTLPALLISSEPSAFGAGDLTSSTPYGLTSSEKVILETKQTLNKVSVKSKNQANELDSLRDRIDGIQGIVESISKKTHENKMELQKFRDSNDLRSKSGDEYEKRLADRVQSNSDDVEKLKKSMSLVSRTIDKINKEYVTKAEFNKLIADVNNFKSLVAKELQGTGSVQASKSTPASSLASTATTGSLSNAELYARAQANFDKKLYTAAIEDYENLIKANYKPAYANYMVGEMNFRRKNYSDAIAYFKTSSSLYPEAPYMPALLLNTAISMNNSGDASTAKAFFKAVAAKYPNSQEAKKAKEYLK